MSKASWLGSLSFIVLINDLVAGPTLYKYVDDTTLSGSVSSTSQVSDIDSHIKCLLSWTAQNYIKINYSKTKEMLHGPPLKLSIPPLVVNYNSTERICRFKLLGVYISDRSLMVKLKCILAYCFCSLVCLLVCYDITWWIKTNTLDWRWLHYIERNHSTFSVIDN